jgi:hypothetical protein
MVQNRSSLRYAECAAMFAVKTANMARSANMAVPSRTLFVETGVDVMKRPPSTTP